MKSLLQNNQECYYCHKLEPLQCHHVMNGPNRKHSDRFGLVVWLCPEHHEEIHRNQILDEGLKRRAQEKFEHKYDRTMWMQIFRKNYL